MTSPEWVWEEYHGRNYHPAINESNRSYLCKCSFPCEMDFILKIRNKAKVHPNSPRKGRDNY